jgi:hypothetical protein
VLGLGRMSLFTLTCYFDSICSCGDADGLTVVEVLQHLHSRAWVGAVFEVGHCFTFFGILLGGCGRCDGQVDGQVAFCGVVYWVRKGIQMSSEMGLVDFDV